MVVNKIDLGPYVDVDIDQMVADAANARDGGPVPALSRHRPDTITQLCDWVRSLVAAHRAGHLVPTDPGPMAGHTH